MIHYMPKVSVIIPTYNNSQYLLQAIASVHAQSYGPIEIIVIDDGSTDNTSEVIGALGGDIIYIKQSNGGPAKARNKGIAVAKGDFVAFLDSDDIWLPDKIEKQIDFFRTHPEVVLVYSRAANFNDGFMEKREEVFPVRVVSGFIFDEVLFGLLILLSSVVVKTSIIKENGCFDEALTTAEDTNFLLKVAYTYHLGGLPEVLVLRRKHLGNLSDKVDIRLGTLENLNRITAAFPIIHPQRYLPMRYAYKIRGRALVKEFFHHQKYDLVVNTSKEIVRIGIFDPIIYLFCLISQLPVPIITLLRFIWKKIGLNNRYLGAER